MKNPQADYLQGTLDLLILKTLAMGPNHGWAVAQRIVLYASQLATRSTW